MKKLLQPDPRVDEQTWRYVVAGWVIATGLLWVFSPFPFLPRPAEVIAAVGDLWQNYNLADQMLASFSLNIEAIVLSSVLSLGLAYASTLALARPLIQVFGKLRFLSMVGLTFAFTLVTTNGHQLKLSMLVFGVSVFFVTGMVDVIAGIPQEQYDLARTLRMGPWETLWEVVILGKADEALVVLRQNAAMGWLLISLVESIERSDGGIGALLMTADKYFHMAAVMAIQLLVLAMGLGQDYALGWLRQTCCPYADMGKRRG